MREIQEQAYVKIINLDSLSDAIAYYLCSLFLSKEKKDIILALSNIGIVFKFKEIELNGKIY